MTTANTITAATGGVVIHPHGVTLSRYLGNAFALIDANGASGVRYKTIQDSTNSFWLCSGSLSHNLSGKPSLGRY
ncbi:fimbria/pilus outer membrane usher protein [Escherichia coli]